MSGRSARPTGDGGNEGQLIAILKRRIRLRVGMVECVGDVAEMIGQGRDALTELLDGLGNS